jgi:DNA ligase-1
MLAHALEKGELGRLDPAAFIAEWKWDGIRVQAAAGTRENGQRVTRLYTRTGEDISHSFPDLREALTFDGAIDGAVDHARAPRAIVQYAAAASQPQDRHGENAQ